MDERMIDEANRLIELSGKADLEYDNAAYDLLKAKYTLYEEECKLINSGKIRGSNETKRNAEIFENTKHLKQIVDEKAHVAHKTKTRSLYYRHKLELTMVQIKMGIRD